jgi:manganese/zinc/iron transport system substrate-binding protein
LVFVGDGHPALLLSVVLLLNSNEGFRFMLQRQFETKKRDWLFGVVGLLFVCFAGCTSSSQDTRADATKVDSGKIRVVATVGMVGDLVREIGGDQVDVNQLMGSGIDPHLYKATRDDVVAIMRAEMVFYCGLMLEGKMADILTKKNGKQVRIAVADSIAKDKLLNSETGDHADPHVWMDVSLWIEAADGVQRALADYRPTHAAYFAERLKQYRAKLELLDGYGKKVMATVPESKRVLITSHDAFRYFGRRYGLEVLGVQGISTDSEAGLQRINGLVDSIVSKQIEAVFVESSVPQDSIQALVQGAESRGFQVKIGGELYSDAMGPAGTYAGTYLGMLDHNLSLVAKSLGGSTPENGFQGGE